MSRSLPRFRRVAVVLAFTLGWSLGQDRPLRAIEPGPIDWRAELSRSQAEARVLDRLVWLQFTGPWCHNCRKMETEVFSDPRVLHRAAFDFVAVKLQSDEHESLALSYGLASLPATVILGQDGTVVAKVEGYLDVEAYLAFLDHTLNLVGRVISQTPNSTTRADAHRPVMEGYCTVSLVNEHRLVLGVIRLRAEHDGQIYLFATDSARTLFLQNPERYVPVNRGECPVARVDRGVSRPGTPSCGVLYEGHLFLCGDLADRARFLKQTDRYSHVGLADRGFCPHCWAVDGLLVRGNPSCSLTCDGRRYLFPDPTHLEAFRAPTGTRRR